MSESQSESVQNGGASVTPPTPPTSSPETKKSPLMLFGLGVAVCFVVAVIGMAGYGWTQVRAFSTDPTTLKIASVFHLPALSVNGEKIAYTQFVSDKDIVKKFYASDTSGASFTDQEITDQVVARLISNTLVGQVARKMKVSVSKEELDQAMNDLISQGGDEATAEQEIQSRFGWTIDEYKQNVLKSIVLEQKLQKTFEEGPVDATDPSAVEQVKASHILFPVNTGDDEKAVEKKAQRVLDRIRGGEDFATLAKEFGTDSTKETGGDLGWFTKGAMVPEFENAVFVLEKGKLADSLVKTQFGFHIVQVTDKRFTRDFATYMDGQLRAAKVKMLIPLNNPLTAYFAELDQAKQGAAVPADTAAQQ